jgi:hypothetical protein
MYRVDRILITGWKTKDEQESGWARHGRAEETREGTREDEEELEERLDAPGRGIRNPTRHEGHVRAGHVLAGAGQRRRVLRGQNCSLVGRPRMSSRAAGPGNSRRNQGGHP